MYSYWNRRQFIHYICTGTALSSFSSLPVLLSSCSNEDYSYQNEVDYSFIENLKEASIVAPNSKHVGIWYFPIDNEKSPFLFQHPNSEIIFKKITIPEKAKFQFSIALHKSSWEKSGDGVLFEVHLNMPNSDKKLIFSKYIDPKNNDEDRKCFEENIDLSSYQNKKVDFSFSTSCGPNQNQNFDWAGWGNPRITKTKKIKLTKKKKKPNIILISIDTLRADHLRCFGNNKIHTPNIDKIATDGVIYRSAIAQAPNTLPSHFSILTSLYPTTHLAFHESSPLGHGLNKLTAEKDTLAKALKKEGFSTAAFVDGGYLNHKYGYDQGFDIYDDAGGHLAVINKKVLDYIEKNHNQNFFLFMHFYDVHGPYEPPTQYRNMYYSKHNNTGNDTRMEYLKCLEALRYLNLDDIYSFDRLKANYMGGVTYADNELGKLFDKLSSLNIYDDTIIIILSDHGESFLEHNFYVGHGLQCYDQEVHIPLIIKFPKQKNKSTVIYDQVESIDVMPTILDVLDVSLNQKAQGRSLLPLFNSKNTDIERLFAYGEANAHGLRFVRTNKWKYIYTPKTDVMSIVNKQISPNSNIKLEDHFTHEDQLYNLDSDPLETNNIITKEKGIANELISIMNQKINKNNMLARSFKNVRSNGITKPQLSEKEKEKLKTLGYIK